MIHYACLSQPREGSTVGHNNNILIAFCIGVWFCSCTLPYFGITIPYLVLDRALYPFADDIMGYCLADIFAPFTKQTQGTMTKMSQRGWYPFQSLTKATLTTKHTSEPKQIIQGTHFNNHVTMVKHPIEPLLVSEIRVMAVNVICFVFYSHCMLNCCVLQVMSMRQEIKNLWEEIRKIREQPHGPEKEKLLSQS